MTNDRQNIFSKISIGNIITIAIIVAGLITTYAKIDAHLSDDNIHINEKTHVVLTIEEYKNLLKFATKVEYEFPQIKTNTNKVIELEKKEAVHESEFKHLELEQEGLEDKVSRLHKSD